MFGISNLLKLPAIDYMSANSCSDQDSKRSRNLKTSVQSHRARHGASAFMTTQNFNNESSNQIRSNGMFGEKQHLKTEPVKAMQLEMPKYFSSNRSSAQSTANSSDQQTKQSSSSPEEE